MTAALVNKINDVLPQTQCRECGYDGCHPYAQALEEGKTTIDRCPPGGVKVLGRLAELLKQDPAPYRQAVTNNTRAPSVARIIEADCIGCTKCLQACPVDAIIGTNKRMHTVYEAECTGCGLCVAPCPVDCIEMHPLPQASFDKQRAQQRYQARGKRVSDQKASQKAHYRQQSVLSSNLEQDQAAKQAYILAARQRKADNRESR